MNRTQRIVLILVLLAAAAFGVKSAVDAKRPQGTDEEQLRRMLLVGEQAAERGDAGGINRLISDNYEDSIGLRDTQLRYQIGQYLRERPGMEITIPQESIHIRIDPDGRTGTVQFRLSATSQGQSPVAATEIPMNVSVVKEPVSYYVFFPGEEWKVVRADGYGALDGGF
jgi:hypothetical protein